MREWEDEAMTTYVTGDVHGSVDVDHLSGKVHPFLNDLTPDDRMVVCGDFGFVWNDPRSREEEWWLGWLEERPWGETCFVDGNHENFDLLAQLPVSEWHGGRVQRLPGHPSVMHLMRGETYEVDGETWWVMGGATSVDRAWREPHRSWWPEELPSGPEREHGLATLESIGFAPDYVLTHEAPQRVRRAALPISVLRENGWQTPHDPLADWLDEIDARLDWAHVKRWYLGHHHRDARLDDEGRHVVLYREVVALGELPIRP